MSAQAQSAPMDARFPVDSFREAAPHLRRPFTVQAVKFKPQSVTKSGKTLCVAYIDARLVVERLNLIVPHLWSDDEYIPLGNKHMICRLTVDGITRQDIGEGAGKALYSDALKRAAVKFGIGVSLYAIPKMFINGEVKYLDDGSRELKELKARYELWLQNGGIQAFGAPLDHGDAEDGQGDAETERTAPPVDMDAATGEIAGPPPTSNDGETEMVSPATADRLLRVAKGLISRKDLSPEKAKDMLAALNATGATLGTAIGELTSAAAAQFERDLSALDEIPF